eukprot:gnl/MRDRNA2_/MRDRNA2_194369_c0_seq1.p1 gnl/MRDRNA2_/MRDRNA2_194369_c0~~gnl/MRDRNA2_/MRDRNA2_194369_c0_seq1.p1  ORF type:complete len:333 (-),score=77.01 gnl/MRDRNA2_/MRDRNA2_194369_c0_seq1:55-999(-)
MPGPGEVIVQVQSTGLCFPDILTVMGKHIFKPEPPFTPCHELCGTVLKVGEGCAFAAGDVVFGNTTSPGTLKEEVRISADALFQAPAGINPHVLAGLEVNYGTTIHALKDVAKLQKGEKLCVLGASGATGISAIELGKAMGAVVVACASSEQKLEACKAAGANILINYAQPGFKERLKKEANGPLDVVYDPVGGEYSEIALRALGFGGRFLVIGFAAGGQNPNSAIPKIPLNLALLNERQIQGVLWGQWKAGHQEENRKNILELVSMLQSGSLRPREPKVYPFEKYVEAMDAMMGRQAIGKICLAPSAGNSSKL